MQLSGKASVDSKNVVEQVGQTIGKKSDSLNRSVDVVSSPGSQNSAKKNLKRRKQRCPESKSFDASLSGGATSLSQGSFKKSTSMIEQSGESSRRQ